MVKHLGAPATKKNQQSWDSYGFIDVNPLQSYVLHMFLPSKVGRLLPRLEDGPQCTNRDLVGGLEHVFIFHHIWE